MKIKVLGLGIEIDWLIKILMEALVKLVDGLVKGEDLSEHGKLATRTLFYLAEDWGDHLVADTNTELDNDGNDKIKELCIDTANEAGFSLPEVPELI